MIVIRRGRARPTSRRSTDIDNIVRSLVSGQRSASMRSLEAWRPALDVYSTGSSLEVVAELAGMSGDSIDVVIEGDVLVLRGVRERPAADRCQSYYEARIPYGPFMAEVVIPFDIEWDDITADYNNGLLTVSLPRRQPRTVEVRQSRQAIAEESETNS